MQITLVIVGIVALFIYSGESIGQFFLPIIGIFAAIFLWAYAGAFDEKREERKRKKRDEEWRAKREEAKKLTTPKRPARVMGYTRMVDIPPEENRP
jgi:hypothetical protein